MSRTAVRLALPQDVATILRLVQDLAVYEREPESLVKATEADLLLHGFGPDRRFEVLLAELEGTVAGFALFFHNYSTWEGRPGLYVEDLFVREHARGHGLGRSLMVALARLAIERGCARLDLNVLDWNPTRAFYERLGITRLKEWMPYRATGEALVRLAEASRPSSP